MKNYLVTINNLDDDETVNEKEVRKAVCIHMGIIGKIVNVTESPFCEYCREEDCVVSDDGTCKMIREYLKSKI